jgi:hypothetical protein
VTGSRGSFREQSRHGFFTDEPASIPRWSGGSTPMSERKKIRHEIQWCTMLNHGVEESTLIV